ncbi:sugar ABC transporter substrate-binding protein [Arthrobacter sp. Helios]|uniref:ABC transporter substrate-binding protein n=1 Tax=Arthrobacter sp. Helios TaxID=2828862 RepID=UPI002062DCD3|nr:sugar ABC transporter substrate-binding protein [Arthrobacter sp. Helios]UPO78598.1 sugar ABC transporter substrate-binding protein [Arthrobacter sp. Helios]
MERRTFLKAAAAGSLALTLPSLAACSSSSSADQAGGDLEYWLWQDDATDQTWQQLAGQFNGLNTGFKVNLQIIPLAQYQDKLLTALSSGGGPDACRFKDWWLGQFVGQKAIASLDDMVSNWDGQDDVLAELYATGKVPGSDSLYMLPHQFVTLYMYYRKSFFKEAGLDAPRTHEDVLRAAEKLTDASKSRFGIDVRGGAGGQDQWAAWMFSGGARMVDEAGNVVLDDPAAISVNQQYLDLQTKLNAAPPGSTTAAFAQVIANFQGGQTGMLIHHTGSLSALRSGLGDDLGVIPMPSKDPADARTLGSMSGNVVLQSSKKQQQAFEWISWLATKEPMVKISTSKQGQLPVLKSAAEDPFFSSDEAYRVAIAAQAGALSWPAVKGTAAVANQTWSPAIQGAFLNQSTSEQMMKKLAEDLRR